MIRRLVRFALRQRLLVLGAVGLLVVLGVRAFIDLPIEAFPDVADIQVQVISQWPGHAAEEDWRTVTLPIVRPTSGRPALTNVQSTSIQRAEAAKEACCRRSSGPWNRPI